MRRLPVPLDGVALFSAVDVDEVRRVPGGVVLDRDRDGHRAVDRQVRAPSGVDVRDGATQLILDNDLVLALLGRLHMRFVEGQDGGVVLGPLDVAGAVGVDASRCKPVDLALYTVLGETGVDLNDRR